MVPYIHIFFFAVKMLQDIHIFVGFWSKCYHIYTHFGVFWDQNAATYTHLCPFFGVKMIPYIHILVKMLLYIHILFFFWSKCCNIYIFVSVFGITMLPYIHILGFFLGQNAAIYTHFWNLIFSEKTKKKKTINLYV